MGEEHWIFEMFGLMTFLLTGFVRLLLPEEVYPGAPNSKWQPDGSQPGSQRGSRKATNPKAASSKQHPQASDVDWNAGSRGLWPP